MMEDCTLSACKALIDVYDQATWTEPSGVNNKATWKEAMVVKGIALWSICLPQWLDTKVRVFEPHRLWAEPHYTNFGNR